MADNPLDILRNLPLGQRVVVWSQVRAETPMGQNPTPEIIDSVLASYYLQQQQQNPPVEAQQAQEKK